MPIGRSLRAIPGYCRTLSEAGFQPRCRRLRPPRSRSSLCLRPAGPLHRPPRRDLPRYARPGRTQPGLLPSRGLPGAALSARPVLGTRTHRTLAHLAPACRARCQGPLRKVFGAEPPAPPCISASTAPACRCARGSAPPASSTPRSLPGRCRGSCRRARGHDQSVDRRALRRTARRAVRGGVCGPARCRLTRGGLQVCPVHGAKSWPDALRGVRCRRSVRRPCGDRVHPRMAPADFVAPFLG